MKLTHTAHSLTQAHSLIAHSPSSSVGPQSLTHSLTHSSHRAQFVPHRLTARRAAAKNRERKEKKQSLLRLVFFHREDLSRSRVCVCVCVCVCARAVSRVSLAMVPTKSIVVLPILASIALTAASLDDVEHIVVFMQVSESSCSCCGPCCPNCPCCPCSWHSWSCSALLVLLFVVCCCCGCCCCFVLGLVLVLFVAI